jgi:hypothetical protein
VLAAAFDAGGSVAEGLHSGHNRGAFRAGVEKFTRDAAALEGEFVAAGFVRDAQIGTGFAPFLAMGFYAAAADSVLCKEVGKFMPERALHLGGGNFDELGIENHHAVCPHRHAGSGAEGGIPKNAHLQTTATGGFEKLVCEIFEERILAQARFTGRLGEVIGLGPDATHDRTAKIDEKLLVFHAEMAG